MANTEAVMEGTTAPEVEAQQEGEQATSLSFLQLHDAFKRMVAVGVDVVDEQTFYQIMEGVPEHLLWLFWQLYMRVVSNVVDNSMAEFDDICRDNDMQQQMADIEALALQKGRALGAAAAADGEGEDPASGPAAAAAAARVAAKRAEKQQLQELLAKLQRQRDDLQSQADAKAKAAAAAKEAYSGAADQMAEVHAAMRGWEVDGAAKAAAGAAF